MEFDTMARFDIPVVCVISNDSAWGMIKLSEEMARKEYIEKEGHCNVDLSDMRAYEKMPQMWGGHGERINDPGDILPAIKRAVANGKPSIINVQVDKVNMSPVTRSFGKSMMAAREKE
jgi:acetolactate synthase-1/2/3 large subunit